MTTMKAWAKADEARALVEGPLVRVTKVTTQAKAVVAKVKWAMAPTVDVGEGGEARPPITLKSTSTLGEACLPKIEGCLKFLEDSIPLEIKEEMLGPIVKAYGGLSRSPC